MADDTRQSNEDLSREALTVNPDNKAFTGTQWQGGKQIPWKPEQNANVLPGGTEHTAGGQAPEVNIRNAMPKSLAEFKELPKRPCMRDSFMTGIGSGFVFGGIRAIWGATVWSACSMAVGTFVVGAIVQREYCMYKRHAEADGMRRAVEIMNRKEMEKRARDVRKEKAREERREAKEREQDAQLAALSQARQGSGKPWWKVW